MDSVDITIIKDPELYKSIIKGALGSIPIVGGVVVELWNYLDARLIDQRLKTLEETIFQQRIDIIDFQNRLMGLVDNEHKFYAVRNNIKHMCLSALPETVDILNVALIEMVMNDEYDMAEHACEVIQQLNANDIHFLKMVETHQESGPDVFKQNTINKAKQNSESIVADDKNKSENENVSVDKDKSVKFQKRTLLDRNISFGNNTIFWLDFILAYRLPPNINDAGLLLNTALVQRKETGDITTYEWSYIVQSMVKLQNLGVIVCEYKMTLGISSTLNIDRFHVTFLGQKIISYVKLTDYDKGLENN